MHKKKKQLKKQVYKNMGKDQQYHSLRLIKSIIINFLEKNLPKGRMFHYLAHFQSKKRIRINDFEKLFKDEEICRVLVDLFKEKMLYRETMLKITSFWSKKDIFQMIRKT